MAVRASLDAHRAKIAVRERRLMRSLQELRRLILGGWKGASDLRARLVLTSQVLEHFSVDEAIAVSYLKARLASQDPRVPRDLRQQLGKLHKAALREIQGYPSFEQPKGRKPRLTRRQEEQVCAGYFALLRFFRDPEKQPAPEHPEDRALLAEINRELKPFDPTRLIHLSELELLSEEIDPGRVAKLALALAFGTSQGTIEKVITRRRPLLGGSSPPAISSP